jgi:ATP-dependent Lhr-like helicase
MVGVTGGRWEIARSVRESTLAERMDAAFDRWGILCRETAELEELRFSEALTLLRQMEYTAQVRRGYFVKGLSGAQFVRTKDFERIRLAMRDPGEDSVCLNAIDPSQAWGRILPHAQDRAFMCVSGTAVVMSGGEIKLVLERQGTVLRSFDAEKQDYAAVSEAFRAGRLFPQLHLLTVRDYPHEAGEMLETVGFIREMRDYVLDKRRI